MSIWGSLLGGVVGFSFGGPIGALIGSMIGGRLSSSRRGGFRQGFAQQQQIFAISLMRYRLQPDTPIESLKYTKMMWALRSFIRML